MRTLNVYTFNEKMPELGKCVPIIPTSKERRDDPDFYCGHVYNRVDALKDDLKIEDDEDEIADIKERVQEIEESSKIFAIEWDDGDDYADTQIDPEVIGNWEWIDIE